MSSSVSSRDSGPHSDQLEAVVRQLVVYQPPTVLPDWSGCRPIGLLLIGLDRRITRWAGRPKLGCFKKTKNRPISCFFLHFYLSHVILICSSSKYHSKIMFSAVINSFFLNAALFVHFNRDLSINLPSFMLVRCDDS